MVADRKRLTINDAVGGAEATVMDGSLPPVLHLEGRALEGQRAKPVWSHLALLIS